MTASANSPGKQGAPKGGAAASGAERMDEKMHGGSGAHSAHEHEHGHEREQYFLRFPLPDRIEHIITMFSFIVLASTGLPQMFFEWAPARSVIGLVGGIETVRTIHRWAALVLILGSIWHIAAMGYKIYVQGVRLEMLPGWNDVKEAVHQLAYNFRLVKDRPKMGKYNFTEKAEYWALIWGTVVMMVTGYMLWNPIATTNFLPGQVIPIALTAHGLEAVLAVLSILTWHMYHVHLRRFNKSMFSGYLSREEMEHEHARELEKIEKGLIPPLAGDELRRRRARLYVPVAGAITVFLFLATFYFLTFEETAIITVPTPEPELAQPLISETPQTP